MKRIGILQPGRLGDIIICLPIAKHYFDLGYKVIWPIFDILYPMCQPAIDYVTFLPVTNNVYECVKHSKVLLEENKVDYIFDIAATFPNSSCTEEYVILGDGLKELKFDKFKLTAFRMWIIKFLTTARIIKLYFFLRNSIISVILWF